MGREGDGMEQWTFFEPGFAGDNFGVRQSDSGACRMNPGCHSDTGHSDCNLKFEKSKKKIGSEIMSKLK